MSDETPDPFKAIREHKEAIEAIAEWDNQLGADARCFLAWEDGEQPSKADVKASHFNLDSGSDELGMFTLRYTGPQPGDAALRRVLKRVLAARQRGP